MTLPQGSALKLDDVRLVSSRSDDEEANAVSLLGGRFWDLPMGAVGTVLIYALNRCKRTRKPV
jgi:hypothetical protein